MNMNFLPKPPTDNLYKFVAILGLWMLVFTVAIGFFINFMIYQIEQETETVARLMGYDSKLSRIERRLQSIEDGELDQNIVDTSPVNDGSQEELNYLIDLKGRIKETVDELESRGTDYAQAVKVAWGIKLHWFLYIFPSLSCLFFWFGFRQWYFKIQKPSEDALAQQRRINELTIQRLEQEIALTKKSSWTRYARR